MNSKRILFPTDFSQHSQSALKLATSFARDAGAQLLIVHVKEPPVEVVAAGGLGVAELGLDMESIKEKLEDAVPTDPTVPYEHYLLMGAPVTEIVRFAKEQHVDLIVMSTHGRTGLMHLLMGSVAEAVVRRAPCLVMTLRVAPEPALDHAAESERLQTQGV